MIQWVLDYPNLDYLYPDIRTSAHVAMFSAPPEKKTLQSLELCYKRKQICCMNDFRERYNAFSMQYGMIYITIYNIRAS